MRKNDSHDPIILLVVFMVRKVSLDWSCQFPKGEKTSDHIKPELADHLAEYGGELHQSWSV